MMLKNLHLFTVSISILLFMARGSWLYLLNRPLQARWLKIVPHLNDTLLLVSGITLAIQTGQNPLVQPWLGVKLLCLLGYILLGMVAMKWRRQQTAGLVAWLLAIVVFAFMTSVAVTHSPWGLFNSSSAG